MKEYESNVFTILTYFLTLTGRYSLPNIPKYVSSKFLKDLTFPQQ